jgi:hypothetical protein
MRQAVWLEMNSAEQRKSAENNREKQRNTLATAAWLESSLLPFSTVSEG